MNTCTPRHTKSYLNTHKHLLAKCFNLYISHILSYCITYILGIECLSMFTYEVGDQDKYWLMLFSEDCVVCSYSLLEFRCYFSDFR